MVIVSSSPEIAVMIADVPPFLSNICRPLGLGPNVSILLPSDRVVIADTNHPAADELLPEGPLLADRNGWRQEPERRDSTEAEDMTSIHDVPHADERSGDGARLQGSRGGRKSRPPAIDLPPRQSARFKAA